MIILIAAIVLALGAVTYGTALFKTGAQQEVIAIKGVKMWVDNDRAVAWGAAGVRNSGDKLVSVDKILIRGTTVPYTNWYVDENQDRATIENYQSQFNHTGTIISATYTNGLINNDTSVTPSTACSSIYPTGGYIQQDFDDGGPKPAICLIKSSGPIALSPGEKLIVYFRIEDGVIIPMDSGVPVNVGIFAGKTGAPITAVISNPLR